MGCGSCLKVQAEQYARNGRVHSHRCMEKKAHYLNQPSVTVTSQSKSRSQHKCVRYKAVPFGGHLELQAKS